MKTESQVRKMIDQLDKLSKRPCNCQGYPAMLVCSRRRDELQFMASILSWVVDNSGNMDAVEEFIAKEASKVG